MEDLTKSLSENQNYLDEYFQRMFKKYEELGDAADSVLIDVRTLKVVEIHEGQFKKLKKTPIVTRFGDLTKDYDNTMARKISARLLKELKDKKKITNSGSENSTLMSQQRKSPSAAQDSAAEVSNVGKGTPQQPPPNSANQAGRQIQLGHRQQRSPQRGIPRRRIQPTRVGPCLRPTCRSQSSQIYAEKTVSQNMIPTSKRRILLCGPKLQSSESQTASQATGIVQAPPSAMTGLPSNVSTVVTPSVVSEENNSSLYSSASFIAPQPLSEDGVAELFKRVFIASNELENSTVSENNMDV